MREILQEVAIRINALHPKYGKLVEVGAVYTTIAGLLNILAIYDAYDGPAHFDDEDLDTPAAPAGEKPVEVRAGVRS